MLSHQRGQSHDSRLTCSRDGCGRRFAKAWLLRTHEEAHEGRKKFQCEAAGCSAQFVTRSKLNRHRIVHDNKAEGARHPCTLCHKVFGRLEYLKTHQLTHQAERTHRCPVEFCGKSFVAGSLLARHMRRAHEREEETRERRLTCPHCPKRSAKIL
jgi:uncharacterized Zn-finger protein